MESCRGACELLTDPEPWLQQHFFPFCSLQALGGCIPRTAPCGLWGTRQTVPQGAPVSRPPLPREGSGSPWYRPSSTALLFAFCLLQYSACGLGCNGKMKESWRAAAARRKRRHPTALFKYIDKRLRLGLRWFIISPATGCSFTSAVQNKDDSFAGSAGHPSHFGSQTIKK